MSLPENVCSCAQCDMERVPRTGWMRLVPLMGMYECGECGIREMALRARISRNRRHAEDAPLHESSAVAPLGRAATTTANAVIETRIQLK